MIKHLLIVLFVLPIAIASYGQEAGEEEHNLVYHHMASGGGFIHAHGWGFNFRRGYHLTAYKRKMFEVEFATMKHPKEIRTVSSDLDDAKSYVYGKLNSVFLLRTSYGRQKILTSKAMRGNVEIRMIYMAGFSLAMLKPVYFEIDNPQGETKLYQRYDENATRYNIRGGAPFSKGFDELSLIPGVHGKIGFSFEYSKIQDDVRAIEIGVKVDGYYKNVPIMAIADNYPGFISAYVGLVYGAKWYR